MNTAPVRRVGVRFRASDEECSSWTRASDAFLVLVALALGVVWGIGWLHHRPGSAESSDPSVHHFTESEAPVEEAEGSHEGLSPPVETVPASPPPLRAGGTRGLLATVAVLLAVLIVGGAGAGVYAIRTANHSRSCNRYNEIITVLVDNQGNVPNQVWDQLSASDQIWINGQLRSYYNGNPTHSDNGTPTMSFDEQAAVRDAFLLRHGCS